LAKDQLSSIQLAEIKGEIDAIRAQLANSSPNTAIVTEAVRPIRVVVEGVAGNVISVPVIEAVKELTRMVGLS
jgi:hypothetical protein